MDAAATHFERFWATASSIVDVSPGYANFVPSFA